MMENEEKEDLLVDVTGSEEETCEKEEEIDYYIRDKILDFIEKEKKGTGSKGRWTSLLVASVLVFLSSSTLVVVFPIYAKYSTLSKITTYSKLVTVSTTHLFLFALVHIVRRISKGRMRSSPARTCPLSFFDVLKSSLLLCASNASVFALVEGNFIRCHLEDPLRGFSIVFSLLFYYVLSKKKMSVERTFCAITIIVGVFVSVDFGICDKFRCNGLSKVSENTPKLHSLFVLLYLISHGAWVLHFTLIEVCWTTCKDLGSNSNPSILSNGFSGRENVQGDNLKHLIQSLSVICQEEEDGKRSGGDSACDVTETEGKKKGKDQGGEGPPKGASVSEAPTASKSADCSLVNSLPCFSLLSLCESKKFPVTSTPKNETRSLSSWSSVRFFDVPLWQHVISSLLILSFCWLATLPSLNEGKPKLLVDVISDVTESFRFHSGWKSEVQSSWLPSLTIAFSVSYAVLILSSLELLKGIQSTVTLVSMMMPALPVSSLFWSLFRMNENSYDVLEFYPEVTGEAVCAILGLPIIGIGIVLLLKSHIREFDMPM